MGDGLSSSSGSSGSSSDGEEVKVIEHKPVYVKSENSTCPPGKAVLIESFEECAAAIASFTTQAPTPAPTPAPKKPTKKSSSSKTTQAPPTVAPSPVVETLATVPCNIRNPRGCYIHEKTGRGYWNPCGNPFSTAPGRVVVCRKGLDKVGECIKERKWLRDWELAGVNATERSEIVKIELDRYYFKAGLPVMDFAGVDDAELVKLCNPREYVNKTDIAIDEETTQDDGEPRGVPPFVTTNAAKEPPVLPPPDHHRRQAYVKRRDNRKIREKEDAIEQRELMETAGDDLGKDYEEMLAYRRSQAGGQEGDEARNLLAGVENGGGLEVTVEDLEKEYRRVVEEGDYELAKRFQGAIKKRRTALLDALVLQKNQAVAAEDYDTALRLKDEILLLNATIHPEPTKTPKNFTVGATIKLIIPVLFKNGSKLHPGDIGIVQAVPGSKKVANSPATVRVKGILFDLRPNQAVVVSDPLVEETEAGSETGGSGDGDKKAVKPTEKPKVDKKKKKQAKVKPTPEPDFLGDEDFTAAPTLPPRPVKNTTTKATKKPKTTEKPKATKTPATVKPPKTTAKNDTTAAPKGNATHSNSTNSSCPGGSLDACIDRCPMKELKSCAKACLAGCKDTDQAVTNKTEAPVRSNRTCNGMPFNETLGVFTPVGVRVDEATMEHVTIGEMLVKKRLKKVAKLKVVDVGAGMGVFSAAMVRLKVKGMQVEAYEPRKIFFQALNCSLPTISSHRTALLLKKSLCLVKASSAGPNQSSNQTDLLPPYALSCTSGTRTVPSTRGDAEITNRIHLLRIAALGLEDMVLGGFKQVFEGPGVDFVVTTVTNNSLKGVQAFFAGLPGMTTLSWTNAPLASVKTVPAAPVVSILYQRSPATKQR
eukprot:TRINITY_DN930_c0_g1_i1.p1 TRINITY_DN930_c0_g1~~TRINITY_DN930_c0_g1_i1.p1  ORF type:complete len:893 (+),score=138.98 TRINITY_DN930_c0_g1_i1:52-2679(+)